MNSRLNNSSEVVDFWGYNLLRLDYEHNNHSKKYGEKG